MTKPLEFFQGTEMPNTGWWEVLWADPARVLQAVGFKAGDDAIDLCSGDGWFTLPMAKQARRVAAVDIDPVLLEKARAGLNAEGITNCEFKAGDAYTLASLVPWRADFIFLANAFHGVPDRPRLARSVNKSLKSGGRFAIVNWHKRPREETVVLEEPRGPRTDLRMSPDETIRDVAAGGLLHIKTVEIPPYHYGAVFKSL